MIPSARFCLGVCTLLSCYSPSAPSPKRHIHTQVSLKHRSDCSIYSLNSFRVIFVLKRTLHGPTPIRQDWSAYGNLELSFFVPYFVIEIFWDVWYSNEIIFGSFPLTNRRQSCLCSRLLSKITWTVLHILPLYIYVKSKNNL
jgi:hypothetical protein